MSAVPQESWTEYAEAVWGEFTQRTGKPERIMSPAEWWLLRGWLKQGIPLRIVLRGLADTKGRGMSLTYYQGPVLEAYSAWRRLMSFGGGEA